MENKIKQIWKEYKYWIIAGGICGGITAILVAPLLFK